MIYRITVYDSNHGKLADTLLDADSEEQAKANGRTWFNLYHGDKARRTLVIEAVLEPAEGEGK